MSNDVVIDEAVLDEEDERIVFDDLEIGEIAMELDDWDPHEVIDWSLSVFGERIVSVSSLQSDGMVVLDMAYAIKPDLRVVTVDTGRLHPVTHAFVDEVRARYPQLRLEVHEPDAAEVATMVDRNGIDLFRDSVEQRLLCCQIRKVRPLLKALAGVDAWFTGLRREQWASRANIRKVELDHDHDGIVKVNPLADWTEDEVWDYIRDHDVPTHPLYAQGYTSIGCGPCTRPVQAGEDSRAGRWWWEVNAPKECGMHCPIETGGFEHEVHAILGEAHH